MSEQAFALEAQSPAESAIQNFTMDENLLVSVIRSQAGSLSKALLEGVMNSIDAGATRVDITLDSKSFTIVDNGKGFGSAEEVRNWFGRFGTPHQAGDAKFGFYRMGRGQMFSYAVNTWTSGEFCMLVDINGKGLTYELSRLAEPVKGCTIRGELYQPLSEASLRDTLQDMRQFVAYTPKPVYVNGVLFGGDPSRLKSWTYEDEFAYYKVTSDSNEMLIYNQGVFVCSKGAWTTGTGGVVVSKVPLKVNFARNSILENECETWKHLKISLEATVTAKLSMAKKLNDDERQFLARRLKNYYSVAPAMQQQLRKAKLFTDPTGRHIPLEALRKFKRFVLVERSSPLACSVHGVADTCVVTESMLHRFGVYSLNSFLDDLRTLPGIIDPDAAAEEFEDIPEDGRANLLCASVDDLNKRQAAAFRALSWLNNEVQLRLAASGFSQGHRELRLGRHKKNKFVAWTDGKSYVTANVNFLKLFEKGLDGVMEWHLTLVHEYAHDTDDSESHSHGEVFYTRFHDMVFSGNALEAATLAQRALMVYFQELRMVGTSVPRHLRKQLKPLEAATT